MVSGLGYPSRIMHGMSSRTIDGLNVIQDVSTLRGTDRSCTRLVRSSQCAWASPQDAAHLLLSLAKACRIMSVESHDADANRVGRAVPVLCAGSGISWISGALLITRH